MLISWPDDFPTREAVEAFPGLLRGAAWTERNALILHTAAAWATKRFAFPVTDGGILGPMRQPMQSAALLNDEEVAAGIEANATAPPEGAAAALNPILVSLLIAAAKRLLPKLLDRLG
jgi:hypothetical protein